MKKILITGENSYVGNSFEKWMETWPDRYSIEKISVRDDTWKGKDFSSFDVILHVAGIAHRKETRDNAELYYRVNRDLAYEITKKAKNEGVKQFIFLSSMSVYGLETGVIDQYTPLKPKTYYGKSKLQAEELVASLEDKAFKVAILRPPMIYGKGCKGNYQLLSKLAIKTPIFPNIENNRSMIFIDNLCKFVKTIIDNSKSGLFLPQNNEYVKTSEMVRLIAGIHGKKIWLTKMFNPFLRVIKSATVNKVFGDLVYKRNLTGLNDSENYTLVQFEESIRKTED